ncbi:MAG: helix-turn-helix domain-containing protein [Acidobacteriota bacterium]
MAYNAEELLKTIEAMLAEEPRRSLTSIQKDLKIERHTLARVIRKCYQQSFRRRQKEIILKKARELLAKPNLTIKEVAITLGYQSPQAFDRLVKRITGTTPSQLRKQPHQTQPSEQDSDFAHLTERGSNKKKVKMTMD